MDNTLVYEAGDCGSIPYVGTKFNAALAEWLGTVLIRRLERERRFNSYRQHQVYLCKVLSGCTCRLGR